MADEETNYFQLYWIAYYARVHLYPTDTNGRVPINEKQKQK